MANFKRNMIELVKEVKDGEIVTDQVSFIRSVKELCSKKIMVNG